MSPDTHHRAALPHYLRALSESDIEVIGPGLPHVEHSDLYWGLSNVVVRDVMTEDVVSVHSSASFKELVRTLSVTGVGAVPVIDDDRHVLGVVSVSDLITRIVVPGAKSHAQTAAEVMTSPPITTSPTTHIIDAARLSSAQRARRLPVIDAENRLVGIVTRADLLRVFLRSDEEIRQHIRNDLLAADLGIDPSSISVLVIDGVVFLTGQVPLRSSHESLVAAVRQIAGVVAVHDQLNHLGDDLPTNTAALRP